MWSSLVLLPVLLLSTVSATHSCPSGQYKSHLISGDDNATTNDCNPCGNGGATYVCGTGYYRTGSLCSGGGTSDTQTCSLCTNGGVSYACGTGKYKTGSTCNGNGNSNTQQCTSCPAGKYEDGRACHNCVASTVGKYSTVVGAVGAGGCTNQNCPAGSYCNTGGCSTPTCYPCPGGFWSTDTSTGRTSCQQTTPHQCPRGKFAPAGTISNSSAVGCTNCVAGKIAYVYLTANSDMGQASCRNCLVGRYVNPAHSGQWSCPNTNNVLYSGQPGNYYNPICSAGKYALAGSTVCSICNPGFYSLAQSGSCTTCPKGWYQTNPQLNLCNKCEKGRFYKTTGSAACTDCAKGSFAPRIQWDEDCLLCPPGLYGTEGSDSLHITASSCIECEPGKKATANRTDCTLCPVGKYSTHHRQGHCKLCIRNTYQDEEGHKECKDCAVGEYQTETGQTSCTSTWKNPDGDSRGCPYNPLVQNIDNILTDCKMTLYGETCQVKCMGGYLVSSALTTCTAGQGWSTTTCDKIISYDKKVVCTMNANYAASCRTVH